MALQLTPAGYQKIMAARSARPGGQQVQGSSIQPSTMDMVRKYGRLLSSAGKMFGGETGGQGAAGLNALLSGLGSYQSFQRGQTFPGVMQAAGAAGSGARMLGAGGIAGSIGGLGSLAGLGYDLSQGRFGAQSVGQGLAGAGQLASGLGYGALGSA